ncbi:arylamine N-acetyltransferase family protein [Salinispora pacifica]|uniref:arylamine N-acetyltransferase family protein n=1 Tax=Salinispora pacifica TaxID=351187 RepID=UPI0003759E50|nr:arylamine N-acetyltransferase [Salinispora pacifica]
MASSTEATWPLDAYLDRIGYRGPREPTLSALQDICRAHAESVPFETLDAPEGVVPSLDQESVFTKVVPRRGGGACLEVNALLAAALRRIGFAVDTVLGEAWRVLERRYTGLLDHMVLLVRLDGTTWVVDVGFATLTPVLPVPLDSQPWRERGWWFRMRPTDDLIVAERAGTDGVWRPLYRFRDDPQPAEAFEDIRDHYLRRSTRMSRTLMCARWSAGRRLTLINDRLVTADRGVESVMPVGDEAQAAAVLAEIFRDHEHLVVRALRVWRRLFPDQMDPIGPTPAVSSNEERNQ